MRRTVQRSNLEVAGGWLGGFIGCEGKYHSDAKLGKV